MLRRERPADQVSLRLVTTHLLEQAEGRRVFDAFGDDPLAELVSKVDTRLDDGAIPFTGAHLQDEGTIDLDFVHGKSAQIGEGGVTGAKVVDGELKPHFAEPLEDRQ